MKLCKLKLLIWWRGTFRRRFIRCKCGALVPIDVYMYCTTAAVTQIRMPCGHEPFDAWYARAMRADFPTMPRYL